MASSTRFRKLLEPGLIGAVKTRNRILKMGAKPGSFGSIGGDVPPGIKDYYEALARGGAGLVVVAGGVIPFPRPKSPAPLPEFGIDDDKYIPSLQSLVNVIRKYDCPAFMQVFTMGPMSRRTHPETLAIAASSLRREELPRPQFSATREMTVAEIEELVHLFGNLAERAHKAGFQGIELNAACNHLFNSFLSRAWNRRQDAYSVGSLESRAKIVTDIIREVKRRNGADFAVVPLINGAEPGLANGITSAESQAFSKIMEAAGADAIEVRCEFYTNPADPNIRDSTHFPDIALYPEIPFPLGDDVDTSLHGAGGWVPLAAAVKKSVSIPVITVGRIDASLGEKILRQKKADFVALNRRLMVDHDFPNKIAEGRLEDIVPCTGCFTCFSNNHEGGFPLCQVNASLGKEREYEIRQADEKKRVMVVGGGPAGMEAARVAALRGHDVVLFEKENSLGGALRLAAMVKGFEREDLLGLVKYYQTALRKLGVDVRTGSTVDKSTIEKIKPDALVLAAGGAHNVPDLPGITNRKVVTSQALHKQLKQYLRFIGPKTVNRLTKYWMPLGKNVVIMGGNIQGCQVAAFLVKRGRKVTILETGDTLGDGLLVILIRPLLLDWLSRKGTRMLTGVKYEEITDKGITITIKDGGKETIAADNIVTALPLLPNTELTNIFSGSASEIFTIGDCKEPHLIVDAIASGARVGRMI